MSIRDNAIEFIRKNPGSTARQIAVGAEIPHRLVLSLMTELFVTDVVARSACGRNPYAYRLAEQADVPAVNDQYEMYRNKAVELERKGLWRRASGIWLLAMDSTRDEAARNKATARRQRCIVHSCSHRVWSEGSSISSVSVPELDDWREW